MGLQWGRREKGLQGKESASNRWDWSFFGSLVILSIDVAHIAGDQKLGEALERKVDFGSRAEIKYLVLLNTYGWKPVKL